MKISLTPKLDFLADKTRASTHQDFMASPAFKSAALAALLQMQLNQTVTNLGDASIAQIQLKGAEQFLRILMNLGESEKLGAVKPDDNLIPV
jgi:hypothetical protein